MTVTTGAQGTPVALPDAWLSARGLNRQAVFDLATLPADILAMLAPQADERQLILLGHGGRRLWDCVLESEIGGADPIDDYTQANLARWFAERLPGKRYRLLYPGNVPIGLQSLGRLAGWHHATPFMLGIDAHWGTWYAYRAVLLADTDFPAFSEVDRDNPCLSCAAQPCIAACPAQALGGAAFDLPACIAQRLRADSACAFACPARLACPVGPEHRYSSAQMAHSYGISLAMLREYAARTG